MLRLWKQAGRRDIAGVMARKHPQKVTSRWTRERLTTRAVFATRPAEVPPRAVSRKTSTSPESPGLNVRAIVSLVPAKRERLPSFLCIVTIGAMALPVHAAGLIVETPPSLVRAWRDSSRDLTTQSRGRWGTGQIHRIVHYFTNRIGGGFQDTLRVAAGDKIEQSSGRVPSPPSMKSGSSPHVIAAASPTHRPPGTARVDLWAGPYSGCPGSGCAKGDYRFAADATVSKNSFVLTTPSGSFTSGDVGKRGVAVDWNAPNVPCGAPWAPAYGCYTGVSCAFVVSAVTSASSITVTPVGGCGKAGIGFNSSGAGYWAVYTDDWAAVQNAVSAAAGGTLTVPAAYKGSGYAAAGVSIPGNTAISCAPGATFYNSRLDTVQNTYVFGIYSGPAVTITGCTFTGTAPAFGAYYDPTREYNLTIAMFSVDAVSITGNTFRNMWGTNVIETGNVTNLNISNNTFQNNAFYGVQLGTARGSSPGTVVSNNTFIDTFAGSEDPSNQCGGSACVAPYPNGYQLWTGNTFYTTAQGGTGYHRTQIASGLSSVGALWLDCGTSASGATPDPGEYTGVTCQNNHVSGPNTHIFPAAGTAYPNGYGEVMIGNVCDNGCNGSSVSSLSISTLVLPGGIQNLPYSTTLAATGGSAPYTWSVISGSLPSGLTLAPGTGIISGNPAVATTSSFTVQVGDSKALTAAWAFTIVIGGGSTPAITTTSVPGGMQNLSYSTTLAATSGTMPYSWSITSGALPPGLSLGTATGTISGTPIAAGTSSFTVQVRDYSLRTATKALGIVISASAPLAVTTTTMASGVQSAVYSTALAAKGGTPPYTWSISAGTLPLGLTLGGTTGIISGIPSAAGTSNFTVRVTDRALLTATQALSIAIAAAMPAGYVQSAQNSPAGTAGPTATASLTGTIPGHLLVVQINNGDDVVTSVSDTQHNVFNKAVSLKAGNQDVELWYAMNIAGGNDTVTVTGGSNTGYVWTGIAEYGGIATSNALDKVASASGTGQSASSGNTATTSQPSELVVGIVDWYSCTSGAIPVAGSGLAARQSATCLANSDESVIADKLVGSAGVYNMAATGANSSDSTWVALAATFKVTGGLAVPPAGSITTTALPGGVLNMAYNATLAAAGGTPPYKWSIAAGALPTGLSLAGGTGVISGAPTIAGTSSFTVQLTDANLVTATKTLSIAITGVVSPSYVQSAQNNPAGTGGAIATVNLTGTTAGHLLVVQINNGDDVVASVRDTQQNVFTKAVSLKVGNQDIELWYAMNIAGGNDTVTVTGGTGTGYVWAGVAEYSGIATSNALDKIASASGTGQSGSSGNTAITNQANEVVVGIVDWYSCTAGTSPTTGNGLASRQTATCLANSDETVIADKMVAAAGAYSVSATGARSSDTGWVALVATFKGAGGH
jgi:hypothetical protein